MYKYASHPKQKPHQGTPQNCAAFNLPLNLSRNKSKWRQPFRIGALNTGNLIAEADTKFGPNIYTPLMTRPSKLKKLEPQTTRAFLQTVEGIPG